MTAEISLAEHIFESFDSGAPLESSLDKHTIYAKLFNGKTFAAATINNLFSATLRLARRFIEMEESVKDKHPVKTHLAYFTFFYNKPAPELARKYLKRMEDVWAERKTWENEQDFYLGWKIELAKTDLLLAISEGTDDVNFKNQLKAWDEMSLLGRMSILAQLFNFNRMVPVIGYEEREALLAELRLFENHPFAHNPLARLLRMAIEFLHYNDEKAEEVFDLFVVELAKEEQNLSNHFIKLCEVLAYNFCVRRFASERYRSIIFNLFRRQVETGRIYFNGKIPANNFISIVSSALLQKEFDWVLRFLNDHRDQILGRQPSEDYYLANLAIYFFRIGEIDKAREITLKLNFGEIQYKYSLRTLEIKILFVSAKTDGDMELVENKLKNLSISMLREEKMPKEKRNAYSAFVNFMMRLCRLRRNPNTGRLRKLLEDIQQAGEMTEVYWLIATIQSYLENPLPPLRTH